VLRGIDLTITPGQATGIVGANGSGKSTLARILAGLSRPSRGTITGRPTRGYVPERFPAQQRMSARAYLCHMGRIRGMSTARARARADELLDRFALAGGPDSPLRELSKGNAQKVGLAQALLTVPELLVLDEPWSGLDGHARTTLGEVMRELVAEGRCVVFTSHRAEAVPSPSTRHFRLADGVLEDIDSTRVTTVHIVLRSTDHAERLDWAEQAGVLAAIAEDGRVDITAAVSQREGLLLSAIRRGWSVLTVSSDQGSSR
jgi:ABC-type multidrug transport system ATPase subunit